MSIKSIQESSLGESAGFTKPLGGPSGYFCGGIVGSSSLATDRVDKLNYSSETIVGSPIGVGVASRRCCGVASTSAGYKLGGRVMDPLYGDYSLGIADKITFSNDARSILNRGLITPDSERVGFSSSEAGYSAGGQDDGFSVYKLRFSDETAINVSSLYFSEATWAKAGFSSSTHGYTGGGSPPWANLDFWKIPFATETRSNTAPLNTNRYVMASFASSTHGYFAGGLSLSSGDPIDSVEKYSFATDTCSNITATLSTALHDVTGVNSSTAGYVSVWFTNSFNKFDFSNDTRSSISASIPAISGRAGFSSTSSWGL